jgi:glutamate formiminotransferase / 5-formyltetrahydrofolate cyclo-ligase
MTLVECVPNFSEGRRPEVIDEIVDAMAGTAGVHVLDLQSDATHNRCVITVVGPDEAAAEAAFRGIATAARLIDLTQHRGAHPRFGAADVVPFVPVREADMPACVELARRLARRVGDELGIPAYLYEDAALREECRDLADVRRGEFEGLCEVIAEDPARAPDAGPRRMHPTAGAVAVGARPPLIAYNVNLDSDDVDLAREIAVAIRERDGGFPKVKAMGLALDDCVQVSMNLVDYRVTSMHTVYTEIARRAAERGAAVRESEVVGLLPEAALVDLARRFLRAADFTRQQVLEARVLDLLTGG